MNLRFRSYNNIGSVLECGLKHVIIVILSHLHITALLTHFHLYKPLSLQEPVLVRMTALCVPRYKAAVRLVHSEHRCNRHCYRLCMHDLIVLFVAKSSQNGATNGTAQVTYRCNERLDTCDY
jgi:hypothetical protein